MLTRTQIITILLSAASFFSMQQQKSLVDWQDNSWLVLIHVNDMSHEGLDMQLRFSENAGYDERDLKLLIHHEGSVYDALRQPLNLNLGALATLLEGAEDQVLLLNADSYVKMNSRLPTENNRIFSVIDQRSEDR